MEHFKLLIVDDLAENLKIMTGLLEKYLPGCHVYQTNSPQNAIEIAQKTNPDLIITDWDMPQISGIELIKAIKSHKSIKMIPIIMATGIMLTADDLKSALDAGAIDYIRKPLDPIELTARVHSALVINQMHRDNVAQKDKKLAEKAILLVKSNEFNIEIRDKLTRFAKSIDLKGAELQEYNSIIQHIETKIQSNSWERFELAFDEVHPMFNKNLLRHHDNLTPSELRLCSFVRMGLSIKDISSVLYQSPDSIKVSRSRLRKKLMIDKSQNLETFLAQY